MDYDLQLWPADYGLVLSRAFLIQVLAERTITALALLVDPTTYPRRETGNYGPFLQVRQTSSRQDFDLSHFVGDELLHCLYPAHYFFLLALALYTEKLAELGPEIVEPDILVHMGEGMMRCIDELSTERVPDKRLLDTMNQAVWTLRDRVYWGDLPALATAFAALEEEQRPQVLHVGNVILSHLRVLGRVPRYDPQLDPTWDAGRTLPAPSLL
jgi:hypothetical protein